MKKYLFPLVLLALLLSLFLPSQPAPAAQALAADKAHPTDQLASSSPSYELTSRPVWRALLLVYHNTDVDYIDEEGEPQHLTTSMTAVQMATALRSFRQMASIAHDFSNGEAIIEYDIVYIDRPVDSLTLLGELPDSPEGDVVDVSQEQPTLTAVNPDQLASNHSYWVSPANSRLELDTYAPPGTYDSVFVHWVRCDVDTDQCVPSYGWGWGLYATDWANGATYATVTNVPDWMWQLPTVGEVWLHEWLHGSSPFYEGLGYPQPVGNADGGGSHGYLPDPQTGWSDYYRDLMTGQVWEPTLDQYTGITPEAWQSRSILSYGVNNFVDYYYANSIANYHKRGFVQWRSADENIRLGSATHLESQLYKIVVLYTPTTISGRVYVPSSGVGPHDTVSIGLHGGGVEYLATLAYGSELAERNHISIMRNDNWGELYPMTLTPGWYNVELLVNPLDDSLQMKVWPDGSNEPDWQLSRPLEPNWVPKRVGFHHNGPGTAVDDLRLFEVDVNQQVGPVILSGSE